MTTGKAVKIICSVKVDDGSFESDISFPMDSSEAERRGAIELWIAMLQRAIAVAAPTQSEWDHRPDRGNEPMYGA